MLLPRSKIVILFTFFTFIFVIPAMGMKSQKTESEQLQLNRKLSFACDDIENPATCLEKFWAGLHCKSVEQQRLTHIENLLKSRANPNRIDPKGVTALHYAIGNLSPDLVRLLVRYKADCTQKVENTTQTPLGATATYFEYINNGMLLKLRNKAAKPITHEQAKANMLEIAQVFFDTGIKAEGVAEKKLYKAVWDKN